MLLSKEVLLAAEELRRAAERKREIFDKLGWDPTFWSRVDIRGEDDCWPWLGAIGTLGYGNIGAAGFKTRKAHRIAFELGHGVPPGKSAVCHSCDNPICCNPHHLWAGTQYENFQDAIQKGRIKPPVQNRRTVLRGENISLSKLKEHEVLLIAKSPEASGLLAARYGVSQHAIWSIRAGKTWSHITGIANGAVVETRGAHWQAIEIDGVYYPHLSAAAKAHNTSIATVKTRAESVDFPNYKLLQSEKWVARQTAKAVEKRQFSKAVSHKKTLSEAIVRQIAASPETSKFLAGKYGTSASVVSGIRSGRTWGNVTGIVRRRGRKQGEWSNQRVEINGKTYASLKEAKADLGLPHNTFYKMRRRGDINVKVL